MFEFQTRWIAGVLSGRIPLESTEEMTADIEAFYSSLEAAGIPKRYTHQMGQSQVIHLPIEHSENFALATGFYPTVPASIVWWILRFYFLVK